MNNQENVPPPPLLKKKVSVPAALSLGLGVVGFLTIFDLPLTLLWCGLGAVVCGRIARTRIQKPGSVLKGAGLARAGLFLGYFEIFFLSLFLPLLREARERAQPHPEKAVLNNARQLSAAADQYYLETGAKSCRWEDIVGPTMYVKVITPVAGETYPLTFAEGQTITITGIGGARTVTYAP